MRHEVIATARGAFALLRQGPDRADGPALLALHGWLDNAASFLPLAAELPGLPLVALDLAGHGHSPHRPPGSWYHLVDHLDDVLAVLDALGWERCALLGHSLGGALATMLAAALPERVSHLLLIEALGPLPFREGSAAASLGEALRARRGAAGKRLRVFADIEAAVAARMQANGLSAAAARLLVERGTRPVPGGFAWRSDARLTLPTPQRIHEAQIREWVAAIAAPTLVIAAEPRSGVLSQAAIEERLALLRDAQAVALPGHHHLHMETPAPVARAIRAFLAARGTGPERGPKRAEATRP